MTRYSLIIGYVLVWQLLMPLICFFTGITWWTAAITSAVFFSLYRAGNWEKNSYSVYSTMAVIVLSLILVIAKCFGANHSSLEIIDIALIYALIAFTATSPYPLSIRMPLIIYFLAFIYMIPKDSPMSLVISSALIFILAMCFLVERWRRETKKLTLRYGPPEPPFSLSLAAAIVAAVAINLGLTIAQSITPSKIPIYICVSLLTIICFGLILVKDWKKNALAVTALILMISLHLTTLIAQASGYKHLNVAIFVLSVAPVMFHTTAPVFRGMRIVITLYAVYAALNKHTLIVALSHSSMPTIYKHLTIIGIDAILLLTLLAMAIHWRNNKILNKNVAKD